VRRRQADLLGTQQYFNRPVGDRAARASSPRLHVATTVANRAGQQHRFAHELRQRRICGQAIKRFRAGDLAPAGRPTERRRDGPWRVPPAGRG